MALTIKEDVTVLFAGDSGDGMQLTGNMFTDTHAHFGNDLSTFPNFPAEIRAPQGSLAGVSGFQIRFGSIEIFTPGDACDVLVAMNAAALKTNLHTLKNSGTIIANSSGFDSKNLRLAGYENNPLESGELSGYQLYVIDVTKLTRTALSESGLGQKDIDRTKNMFVLGFLLWMFDRSPDGPTEFINQKFKKNEPVRTANLNVLAAGYNYGETTNTFTSRYTVKPARLAPGKYRSVNGNQALSLGLVAASEQSGLQLFYGSYPITPASTLLHYLSSYKNFNVKTFQAEDEIAAVCSAIGASFGGALAVTGSSGPGVALKGEAIGLAMILELPLIICNIQRGGPSTGLPTKTEQSDLFQAYYGRNGEAPIPVISSRSPSDCFWAALEASRIAIEHMTPVMLLSDGYIANGSEPWKFPDTKDLPGITPPMAKPGQRDKKYLPYDRDEKLVRKWAIPGMEGLIHRIGGLEKEEKTGNVSYDPVNHENMVKIRARRVEIIADSIPAQELDSGSPGGDLLVIGWGSTYGVIKAAVKQALAKGHGVAHAHLRYLNPFPKNLFELMSSFDKILIPEMNSGQLKHLLQGRYLIPIEGMNKIRGIPFTSKEIEEKIDTILS
ncbi:MAG: 2-oxoacid:acceptor oxidoreductase subunit alpha [Cyclobacteriaceae bacterium]